MKISTTEKLKGQMFGQLDCRQLPNGTPFRAAEGGDWSRDWLGKTYIKYANGGTPCMFVLETQQAFTGPDMPTGKKYPVIVCELDIDVRQVTFTIETTARVETK